VFEAVEQARVEAIGSNNAARHGRRTSTAMLEERYKRRAANRPSAPRRPLEDAVALMVRERLTGDRRRKRPPKWSTCGGRGSRTRPSATSTT
jgi:cobaltochelatase CobT